MHAPRRDGRCPFPAQSMNFCSDKDRGASIILRMIDLIVRIGDHENTSVKVLIAILVTGLVSWCSHLSLRAADPRDLAARLKSDDIAQQIEACERLAELGEEAAEALPQLIEALGNGPVETREAAARVLTAIGPRAAPAKSALLMLLQDRRYWLRDEAAAALVAIGETVVPELVEAIKSESPGTRAAGAWALGEVRSVSDMILPALAAAIQDSQPRVRATAAAALGRRGHQAVPLLAAASNDPESCVAVAVAEALKQLHVETKETVGALTRLLQDPHARLTAAGALQRLGLTAQRAIPALVKAYPAGAAHPYAGIDDAISEALEHIGPPHSDDLAALEKLLQTEEPQTRGLAAQVLGNLLDGDAANAAPVALKPLLADPSAVVRMEAARSIWRLQHDADAVLQVLEGAADGDDYDAIRGVSETLAGIGKPAVPALARLLRSTNAKVRWWAADGPGAIGTDAAEALPTLIGGLSDRDSGVRDAVSRALGAMGAAALPALPQLIIATKESRLDASQLAAAVREMGLEAKSAQPLLVDGLQMGDESARARIVRAICSVGADDEATVEIVTKAIKDGRVRQAWAVDGFACFTGPAAEKGLHFVTQMLEAPEDYEREVAARTLGQMGATAKATLSELRNIKTGKRFGVRVQAALAVWRLSGETAAMNAVLESAFRDEIAEGAYNTWYGRRETLSAVAEMGRTAEPLVPALLDALKCDNDELAIQATTILADIGKPAAAALPALAEMAENTDWPIRQAARHALKMIRE
jgi:HEAT repeat protein